jgi:Putative Flp pilus-assembly TadE/G-like
MTRKSEAGQALVLGIIALSLLLMGIAGLGIDMGYLRYQKRLQQTAADTAAIAGASNLDYNGVVAAAQNAAEANGFTDASGNDVSTCTADKPTSKPTKPPKVCVEINNPPTTGPHQGDSDYVEALVSVIQPTFFMTLLGTNSEPVTARAVATIASNGVNNGCLYTLAPSPNRIEGVNITGNATLNATSCGIQDNGDFDPAGGALTVNAGTFGVAGDCVGGGCGTGSVTCADQSASDCPAYGTPAAANPLAYLTPPTVGRPTTFDSRNITPGTYTGITLTGTGGNYVFPAGTYILTGNFTCHGTPGITGTGVMFYFTDGATFNCSGDDDINLSAPTSGTYAGILFYQDPTDTSGPSLGGNTGSSYAGALYFPSSEVMFSGNASGINVGIVVAASFAVSGHPTINLQGLAGLGPAANSIKNAVLVE